MTDWGTPEEDIFAGIEAALNHKGGHQPLKIIVTQEYIDNNPELFKNLKLAVPATITRKLKPIRKETLQGDDTKAMQRYPDDINNLVDNYFREKKS